MYCEKCGSQIDDDSVFCQKCGEKQIDFNDKSDTNIKTSRPKIKTGISPGFLMICFMPVIPAFLLFLHDRYLLPEQILLFSPVPAYPLSVPVRISPV